MPTVFLQQCSSRGKFGYLSEREKAHSRWPLLSDRKQYLIEHDHSFWFVCLVWLISCMQSVYYFRHVGGKCQEISFLDIFIDIFILVFSNYKKFYLLQAFCKHKAQKPLIYKASGLYYTIQTPYRLSYFLCLSRFLLLKTTGKVRKRLGL